MLVASHTHWAGEGGGAGSRQKIEGAKQAFMEKGLKTEEQGRAQRRRAASCHPSCRGVSGSFVRGLCARVLKLWYGSCRSSTSVLNRLLPALSAVLVCSPLLFTALYRFLFWCLLSDDRRAQGREWLFKHVNICIVNKLGDRNKRQFFF